MIQMSGDFQVRLTGIIFVLYTALPDEVLVEVLTSALRKFLKHCDSFLETFILNGCQKINTCRCTAILMQIKNLRILSLNRVGFTANQVATIKASSCSLNVLCLVGVSLAKKDIRLIN